MVTRERALELSNPTAQEIRAARDVAEGEIRDALRKFEDQVGCEVRNVEIVRICTTTQGDAEQRSMLAAALIDVEIGRLRVAR